MFSPLSRTTFAAALVLALGLAACGDEAPRSAPTEPSRGSMTTTKPKPAVRQTYKTKSGGFQY